MKAKSAVFAGFLHLLGSHWPPSKVVMAVLSGAIGVRSCSGALADANLNPVHVIIAAIIFMLLFILGLLTIIHIVTS
jgi:hypothetical protein